LAWVFVKGSKRFFFEKKKQKTCAPAGLVTVSARCFKEPKSFCFFFFRKRSACLAFHIADRVSLIRVAAPPASRLPRMDQAGCISYIGGMNTEPSDRKVSLAQLGGWRGLLRQPGLVLHTLRAGAHVGRDGVGNHYFEERRGLNGARPRRWVVYAGVTDSSTVAPEWHSWLHYVTDEPLPETGRKPWQKPHLPNRTGTPAGYRPAGHDYSGGKRAATPADYEAWTPES
jgi:NADH:ubiquinone oxidoreductase subunit